MGVISTKRCWELEVWLTGTMSKSTAVRSADEVSALFLMRGTCLTSLTSSASWAAGSERGVLPMSLSQDTGWVQEDDAWWSFFLP